MHSSLRKGLFLVTLTGAITAFPETALASDINEESIMPKVGIEQVLNDCYSSEKEIKVEDYKCTFGKAGFLKWPIIRGVVSFVDGLVGECLTQTVHAAGQWPIEVTPLGVNHGVHSVGQHIIGFLPLNIICQRGKNFPAAVRFLFQPVAFVGADHIIIAIGLGKPHL